VISQSFGATEQTFPGESSLTELRYAYADAAKNKVTVIAASGDDGATDVKSITSKGYIYFTGPAVDWPATDPLVTAVGGTYVDNVGGSRTEADSVWNTTAQDDSPAASGGGRSVVFARPSWQDGVESVVGSRRGVPDISMEASTQDPALIYQSVPGEPGGFYDVGGTSEAAPLFAGVVAVADQVAGTSLGYLNPSLYTLGSMQTPGLVDVVSGNNSVSFSQYGHSYSVAGWSAGLGFDLASGWGTIDAAKFVAELVALHKANSSVSGQLLRSRIPLK
jgi:subtilase family serine protease